MIFRKSIDMTEKGPGPSVKTVQDSISIDRVHYFVLRNS